MTKDEIIAEIRRTAELNGGKALGAARFEGETSIRKGDWFPHYWDNWSQALHEAGHKPNSFSRSFDDDYLIEKLIQITRELNRVPIEADILRAKLKDSSFPSSNALRQRGPKKYWAERLIAFCESRPDHGDVATLWKQINAAKKPKEDEDFSSEVESVVGYVYLQKHGSRREYKIGRTNDPIRREGEIGIQLPERISPIHYIKTDDPAGVETYWHRRFASKRIRPDAEWFILNAADIRAFKRWKRIY